MNNENEYKTRANSWQPRLHAMWHTDNQKRERKISPYAEKIHDRNMIISIFTEYTRLEFIDCARASSDVYFNCQLRRVYFFVSWRSRNAMDSNSWDYYRQHKIKKNKQILFVWPRVSRVSVFASVRFVLPSESYFQLKSFETLSTENIYKIPKRITSASIFAIIFFLWSKDKHVVIIPNRVLINVLNAISSHKTKILVLTKWIHYFVLNAIDGICFT